MTAWCGRRTSALIPLGHLGKQHIYTSAQTHINMPSLGLYMWVAAQFLTLLTFLTFCFSVHEQINTLLASLKYSLHRFANISPQRWLNPWVCANISLIMYHLSVNKYSIQQGPLLYKNAWLKLNKNWTVKQRPKYSSFSPGMSRLCLSLGFQAYVTGRQRPQSLPTTSLAQCEPGWRRRRREQTNDCFSSVCRSLMEMQPHADTQAQMHVLFANGQTYQVYRSTWAWMKRSKLIDCRHIVSKYQIKWEILKLCGL